ncbi:UDP-glucose dehydrogenase family protein [Paenibacillus woosongensis]|uniref:UDP-glucose 6-dehydrogenase n=1 Tax=Paenibacillus woosongensis TaxID=307580 RepID=A0ABQ4MWG5_9BACL|nr:UDP-glucose/GDP-mannose dehydrogenase family protein [Paenibacillus woosongensis]GIP60268.1 UDP-glucose 6-dehydrogenase TuaD [Paenibacillus woosongensis]
MRIAMIGTGYVGLTTGVCYSEMGHSVICADIDEEKIRQLQQNHCPIYEPGLKELIIKNSSKGNLSFTTDIEAAVNFSDIIMIAVGTPSLPDGSVDMSFIDEVAHKIGQSIKDYKVIVNKSTVPVGSADRVRKIVQSYIKTPFDVASVPEFLREGSAVKDVLNGERIVIGIDSEKAKDILIKVHEPFQIPIQVTDIRSAELIKYAANSFLAMKISFINEIANLAEKVGADVLEVAKGIGSDSRIGERFLNAGIGFGGACFPKDTLGIINIAEQVGHDFKIMKEVINVNRKQYMRIIEHLNAVYPNLYGKTVSILGLSFKPNTNDLREAPSIKIINDLVKNTNGNIRIRVYDPISMDEARGVLPEIVKYCYSVEEAIVDSDAAIIVTEWKEIVEQDWKNLSRIMKTAVIIDGRNCLEGMDDDSITYLGIGRKNYKLKIINL